MTLCLEPLYWVRVGVDAILSIVHHETIHPFSQVRVRVRVRVRARVRIRTIHPFSQVRIIREKV